MDRKIKKYLSDILSSILEIESFMENRLKEYGTFCNSCKYQPLPLLKDEVSSLLEQ